MFNGYLLSNREDNNNIGETLLSSLPFEAIE